MTRTRTNVVPFERPASYWAVKARRHDKPAQLQDAARLMRKALEKSGDSTLALELSQIYARMHCYTASERYLMRACAREGLTGPVCFLAGCAALNRGEEELGERAIDLSLRVDPDGPCSEQAQEVLESYPWRQTPWRPRCSRGENLCRRAGYALAAGRNEEALALAKRAWKRAHTPEIALQLGALLPPRRGMILLTYAARRVGAPFRAFLLLARACHLAGQEKQARKALSDARRLCETITDAELFCETAWSMHALREALDAVNGWLEKMPFSADYLRLKYLCLYRLGQCCEAGRVLDLLLEIDPDDVSARRFRACPEEAALTEDRYMMLSVLGSLVYASIPPRKESPLNRILHELVIGMDGLLTPQEIYLLVPPLWRAMTPAEQWVCDDRRGRFYPAMLGVCALLSANRPKDARALFERAPGKKRLLRFLRRFSRG
jgi:tetratricopeptide (TPR) repeat protein